MDVIILAGGLGTRLRSVVNDVPKCMAPVAGQPFLSYLLKYLTRYKVERVVLAVGYLREVIEDWVSRHEEDYPFSIDFSIEGQPLGTGGGIRLAMNKIQSMDTVILNGDTFFDVDLDNLYKQHLLHNASISLALKPMKKFERYGKVELNNHVITDFKEKGFCKEGEINGGIYVVNRNKTSLDSMPEKFSFETDVLNSLSQQQQVYGFIYDRYFIDIGIPEDYIIANQQFVKLFD